MLGLVGLAVRLRDIVQLIRVVLHCLRRLVQQLLEGIDVRLLGLHSDAGKLFPLRAVLIPGVPMLLACRADCFLLINLRLPASQSSRFRYRLVLI